MRTHLVRVFPVMVFAVVLAAAGLASAAPATYVVVLDGPSESPPNASTGTGTATVIIDPVAYTMALDVQFSGLTGVTTNCHIHAPTASALSGTAGVATTTPTFAGFPAGVSAGSYQNTLDMTQASSYNDAYLNNATNQGSTDTAGASLFQAIADGKAYLNIHSDQFPGGEIRGFLTPLLVPTAPSTWGKVKALYR